jgi:predicted transcriptional regulator
MDQMKVRGDTLACLLRLGFSQYEARAYCALLRQSPLNGHEISKASGVPPSKIYETLLRLESKGTILVHRSTPVRYAAVALRMVLEQLRRQFEGDLESAEQDLSAFPGARDPGLTWSLGERGAVLRAAEDAIKHARREVFAALWDADVAELGPALEAASRRKVEVHVAVYGQQSLRGPSCYDLTLCGQSAVERLGGRRLTVVVADGSESVVAEFRANGSVDAIVTNNAVMSLLAAEYIKEDVMGRILINDMGEPRYQRLRRQSPQLRAMLRPVRFQNRAASKRVVKRKSGR